MFLPLVEHPFEAAAVAELVVPRRGGDAVERGRGVDLDEGGGLVGLQLRLELGFLVEQARGAEAFIGQQVGLFARGFLAVVAGEREGRGLLVAEVQSYERAAPRGPLAEVLVKRAAGETPA